MPTRKLAEFKTPIVFFAFFGLYLFTLHPSLAPYRDAGEMATSAWTLGVSHPTSYPLYILLGRLIDSFPLGNPAYRLNLLSAISASGAVALLFSFLFDSFGIEAALGGCALLGFNATFWSIAVVSEMYSLWVLGAVFLLSVAWKLSEKYDDNLWFFFCFSFGVIVSNRLDFVLWSPGLIWLALSDVDEKSISFWAGWAFVACPALMFFFGLHWPIAALAAFSAVYARKTPNLKSWVFKSAVFSLLGISIYFYLPIRSSAGPWLDWNHPANWANFVQSILRTKYGGTLDLISENYAKGSLFFGNMVLYAKHLRHNFSLVGILAALWGMTGLARSKPRRFIGVFTLYFFSGPFFLLLANMPPNPHAMAIVNPHYLLSDAVLIFGAALGLAEWAKRSKILAQAVVVFLILFPFITGRLSEENRREHFFDYDYARNIFLSAPPGATVIAKKDVQLFSLWYYQTAAGWRPDLNIVAQGLIGSPWYENSFAKRAPNLFLTPLPNDAAWKRFLAVNSPAFATPDADVPASVANALNPRGLLMGAVPGDLNVSQNLWHFFATRGRYSYEAQPDFFTSDLIDAYSQMSFKEGTEKFKQDPASSFEDLNRAWAMHWIFPGPPAYLGYAAYLERQYPEALNFYQIAASLGGKLDFLAQKYRALNGTIQSFKQSCSENMLQAGAIEEKLGNPQEARKWYLKSLATRPSAQAHYNLAVLTWNSDPQNSQKELEEALSIDPHYAPAVKYLQILRARVVR